MTRTAARKSGKEPEAGWLEEVIACLEDGRPVRKELPEGGRLHVDRPLPFLAVYLGDIKGEDGDGDPLAREVVQSNASYLLAPDAAAAGPVIEAVGKVLKRKAGAFMVLRFAEFEHDDLLTGDAPHLPPFRIALAHTHEPVVREAAAAFENAVTAFEFRFRTPQVEMRQEDGHEQADGETFAPPFPHITVRFAPIYRQPDSKDDYPELRERLLANLFDAGLRAFATYVQGTTPLRLTTHRALGRKAFIDAVRRTDRGIDEIAASFDFLLAVTPINAEAAWQAFEASGFSIHPRFLYRPLTVHIETAKRKLFSISFDHLEDPVLYRLYREKQYELDLQLSVIAARQTRPFMDFGRALYGPVEPPLLRMAQDILAATAELPAAAPADEEEADCYILDRRARTMIAAYHRDYADFDVSVELRDDLPSGLMVSGRRLLISRHTAMSRRRVEPLLSHEIGVHLLTYFNGSAQGLRLFRSGLAGYEGMQEGLAVFAEYLAGGMTRERLRLLAGRVVGCAAMLDGAGFAETFRLLAGDHGFPQADAFNTTLRLYRGGGLAKDAIYLRGLLQLLDHLRSGGELAPFWMGKISASHFGIMQELAERGLLRPPAVVPHFISHPDAGPRLEKARAGLTPLDMVQH